ncbi:MAG TPA: AbrB/MazE/SpoVT family DNA-binding domain-containing protein [Pseudoflavonifractor sp.]|nr:AbrB/MazE/SpoVT family DNA-binding domain-containing protein [Pseudoflavonifractor sp.]
METKANVRKIDELGRIVLPLEVRRIMGWGEKSSVEIQVEGDCVVLQKHIPYCIYCGAEENLKEYRAKFLCGNCQTAVSLL